MQRIGAEGARLANGIGNEIAKAEEALGAPTVLGGEEDVVVAVIAVGYRAVVVQARDGTGDAEAFDCSPGATDRKAALIMRSSLGEHIECGSVFRRTSDEI